MTRQRSVRRKVDAAVTGTRQRVGLVVRVAAALWVLELVDVFLLGGRLDAFGVRPRTMDGLWGIPAAPLLHQPTKQAIAKASAEPDWLAIQQFL